MPRATAAEVDRLRRVMLLASLPLAACAPLRPAPAAYSGRLSLSVRSEPAQNFSAAFELRGGAREGELLLTSALGTTLARTRWWTGGAELAAGGQTQRFDSMDRLLEQLVGAALPLDALLSWLEGRPAQVAGWDADLSRHGEGRLAAQRIHPPPAVQLRLVLDPR